MSAEKQIAIRLTVLDGGKVKAELTEIGEKGEKSLGKLVSSARPASEALTALNSAAVGVSGVMGGLFAVNRLVDFGVSVVDAERKMENFQRRVKDQTGSQALLNETMGYLNATADRQHRSIDGLSDGYTKMLPLVQAGVLTTQHLRTILEGYTNVAMATGATNEDVSRSLFGLSQGLSTQTLRTEELNQVTEAVPGLLQALDRAMGATAGTFRRLTGEGKMTSEMFRDYLIKALEEYQGTAERTADTLEAKINDLGNAWERFKRSFGVSGPVQAGLAATTNTLNWLAGPQDIEQKLKLLEKQAEIARGPLADMSGLSLPNIEKEIADLREQLVDARRDVGLRDVAEAGRVQRAADDRLRASLADARKDIGKDVEGLSTGPIEKLALIDKKVAETREKIQKMLVPDKSNQGDVDATLAELDAWASKAKAAVNKPDEDKRDAANKRLDETVTGLQREQDALKLSEREREVSNAALKAEDELRKAGVDATSEASQKKIAAIRQEAGALFDARAAEKDRKAAEEEMSRALEQDAKARETVLASLDRGLKSLRDERSLIGLTAREREIHTAVLKAENEAREKGLSLSDPAVQERVDAIRQEAGALYDANQAADYHNKLIEDGKRLTDEHKTAQEKYNDEIARLDELIHTGAIGWKTYEAAAQDARDAMDDAGKDGTDAMDALTEAVEGFGRRSARAIADWATGSKKSFADVGRALVSEIIEKMVYANITGPLASAGANLLSGLGSVFSGGFFAAGGPVAAGVPVTVGELGREQFVPTSPGYIIPHTRADAFKGGGAANDGGSSIVQHITIDARGADAGVEARIRLAMAETQERTTNAIFAEINRGGGAARATGRR